MSTAAQTQSDLVLVDVAEDLMTASVKLRKPGGSVTGDEVLETLRGKNVVINDATRARVDQFVQLLTDRKPPREAFVVAEGTPAQDARDESFVWDERFNKVEEEWREDAPVNFYTFNSIITVEPGEVIGSVTPGAPPVNGVNVKGETIEAQGDPRKLRLHKSVARSPKDPNQIIARTAGRVVERQNILKIEETLLIPEDVDFETGNIDTTVDVHIKGKVTDLFEVKTTRSITIGAAIEAARVTAGRDIVVRRGIVGRKIGLVMAGGGIVAKHASEANLLTLGNLRVGKQLMNCHVCVGGKLDAETAAVIGGSVYARGLIAVKQLGSDANVPTRIVTGVVPEAIREVAMIDRRVTLAGELVRRIKEKLEPLLNGPNPVDADQKDRARQLLAKADEAAARIEVDNQRRNELLENIYTDGTAQVRVSNLIQANVSVRIGDRETVFRKEFKGPVSIEKRKIKNVTEVVAVNALSGSVKVLTSERCQPDELLAGFELEQKPDARS